MSHRNAFRLAACIALCWAGAAAAMPLPIDAQERGAKLLQVPIVLKNKAIAVKTAEKYEIAMQEAVKRIERNRPNSIYNVVYFIPFNIVGPVQLDKDPHIVLNAMMHEIYEIKIPPRRLKSAVEFSPFVRWPLIVLYCQSCR